MKDERVGISRVLLALSLAAVLVIAGLGAYLASEKPVRTETTPPATVALSAVPAVPLIAPGQTQNYSELEVSEAGLTSAAASLRVFAPEGLTVVLNETSVELSPTSQQIPFTIKAEPGLRTGNYSVQVESSSPTIPAKNQTFVVDVVPMLVVMLYPGFYPQNVTVAKGTPVTWINLNSNIGCCDPGLHDVSFLTGANTTSPLLSRLQTWTYTFDTDGVYNYFCTVHPIMKGQITVVG